jgi:molecular chaperone GrpE
MKEDTVEISQEGANKAAGQDDQQDDQAVQPEAEATDKAGAPTGEAAAGTPAEETAAEPAGAAAAEPARDTAPASATPEVIRLQKELALSRDQLLRQVAEFQNYRRRTEQEKNNLVQSGKAKVIQQMLEVLDDFSRSVEAAEQMEQQKAESGEAYRLLKAGIDMVYQKFSNELIRLGVVPIEAVGKPFDEREHEALMQHPAPNGTPPGTVLEEIQKGYRLGDRVLRHTKVVVAT